MRAVVASLLCAVFAAATSARAETVPGPFVAMPEDAAAAGAPAIADIALRPAAPMSEAPSAAGMQAAAVVAPGPLVLKLELPAVGTSALAATAPGPLVPIPEVPATGTPARVATAPNLLVPILEVPSVNLVIWGFDRFVLEADYSYISPATIRRNLTGGWTLDSDSFEVNQFGHPYQGALSFTAARSAGLGFWSSALFPVGGSLMWEYAMETDPPSVNDQITTPFAGALLGEALHRLSSLVLYSPSGKIRVSQEILAAIVNPMRAVNRHGLGLRLHEDFHPPGAFVGQFLIGATLGGGTAFYAPSGDPVIARAGRALKIGVRLEYGLPEPELRLEKPLDHFGFDVELNLAAQPFGVLTVRGLLWGGSWNLGPLDGLGGLYALYDFFNPTPFRISSSGLGIGTTNVLRLGPKTRVLLTGIVGGIALGAAGLSESNKVERDYHFGPGFTELLSLRLLLGGKVSLEVTGRHHWLSGLREQKGWESILQVDVRGELRVHGNHGIGLRYTFNDRAARFTSGEGRPQVKQQGALVRVFWTWRIGGDEQHWAPK